MKIILCLRGGKALGFLDSLTGLQSGLSGLSAYIDGEENVSYDFKKDIEALCLQRGVTVFNDQKGSLKFSSDVTVVSVGWRYMIEAENLFVLHDSLLPKYRGFNPLVTALLSGDRILGASLIKGIDRVDAGPILIQSSFVVDYPITLRQAFDRMTDIYREIARQFALMLLSNEPLSFRAQNEDEAVFSLWRDDEDYRIDWTQPVGEIRRFVDSVGFPYAGASALVNSNRVKIFRVEEVPNARIANRTIGKVFEIHDGCPIVVCKDGLLKICEASGESGVSILPWKRLKSRFH